MLEDEPIGLVVRAQDFVLPLDEPGLRVFERGYYIAAPPGLWEVLAQPSNRREGRATVVRRGVGVRCRLLLCMGGGSG